MMEQDYTGVQAMKEKVYEFVKRIPRGKVATYGQIAAVTDNLSFELELYSMVLIKEK